ncbi:MAG TPA: PilZ domain-containing protein [Thermodesulfobacteriaceae bacterium]|nr:PilZ domain-containing protein [Thermodesulfobacteriaceae bacterium]
MNCADRQGGAGNRNAECSERRRAQRFTTSLEFVFSDGRSLFSGILLDISSGGFKMETHRFFREGTLLTITLPGEPVLKVQGVVRWSNKEGLGYNTGVQFSGLSDEQEASLREFVQGILWQVFKR